MDILIKSLIGITNMFLEISVIIAQVVIAMGIYNVWILRFSQATEWRGADSKNMKDEFSTYGLSPIVMIIVGFLKIFLATLLFAGIWFPFLTRPAALGLAILMLGAILMHLKVRDPIKKFLPASIMFVLCLFVAFFS